MKIFTDLLPVEFNYRFNQRSGITMEKSPTAIIIREVPYFPNLIPNSVKNDWFEGKYTTIGHYIIGTDGVILNTIPDSEVCYHTKEVWNPYNNNFHEYNWDSLSIFIIPDSLDGHLTEKTINSLNELCSYLKNKYPTITQVLTAFEAVGAPEPQFFLNPENRKLLS